MRARPDDGRPMLASPTIEELRDRTEWISSLVALRTATDDPNREAATTQLMESFARVASRAEESSRHELLKVRLGLSETELQVVWLLAALAIDSRAKQAMLSQTVVGPAVTIDTLRRIIYGERPSELGFRELAANGTLRRLALIERNDGHPHDSAETRWTWTLAPRILAWLHGDERVDPIFDGIAELAPNVPLPEELALSQGALADARKAIQAVEATIVVAGASGLGRRTMLVSILAEQGLRSLCIDCAKLHQEPSIFAAQMRGLARECRLLDRVPILVRLDALSTEGPTDRRLESIGMEFVRHLPTHVLATCSPQRPSTRWGRPTIVIELDPPTSEQRASIWSAALGADTEDEARQLARVYPLAPAMIHHAALAARVRAAGGVVETNDLSAGIRAVLDDQLGQLARRVTVSQTWDDLVLPADQMEAIVDLVARVRTSARVYEDWGFGRKVGKGIGVSALFSGPPGTGKTMVAALIARDLGLELYQVDLAKVVSKWIGESERNLAKLFDAAEAGHAVLLFDEADALFGT